jgi:hypothetical protein
MTWSLGRKGLRPWASRGILLTIAALTLATGGSVAVAAAAPSARTLNARTKTIALTEPERSLQEAAMNDLRTLKSELTFQPFLPSELVLPAGDLYNRVTWGSAPASAFGMFISAHSGSAGSRVIHMDESSESRANLLDPRFPLNAFKSILHPVSLSNGSWLDMQQKHGPWQGEWILMRLYGNVAIEIDGLSSKLELEQFAASLIRSA